MDKLHEKSRQATLPEAPLSDNDSVKDTGAQRGNDPLKAKAVEGKKRVEFRALSLDTENIKFTRDEANER